MLGKLFCIIIFRKTVCIVYFIFYLLLLIFFLAKCQLYLILDVERGEGTSVTIERNIENSCIRIYSLTPQTKKDFNYARPAQHGPIR